MATKVPGIAKAAARKSSEPGGIEPAVRKIVSDILEMNPESLDPDAELIKDLGMDSMMALEILATVEKAFRIKIPEEYLPRMTTLNSILEITRKYVPH